MKKIRLGIVGYGNIGRGVEKAIAQNMDTELVAVFTRRAPSELKIETKSAKVLPIDDILKYKDNIDVLILCGGSATDLPKQGPMLAEHFNIVDSFDTHAKIPEYFDSIDGVSAKGNKVSVISVGWDPGLFSMVRMMSNAILPVGKDYTFWGKGVSQGHSDAIRRVEGVKNGIQFTIPVDSAIDAVRNGENPTLSTREKHTRECFIVAKDGADKTKIESDIKNMPNYFADYDTVVNFVDDDEMAKLQFKMPHGGFVFRSGETGVGNKHIIEFALKLDSNPEFTGSILVSYARAAVRMNNEGMKGCKTVFDVPLSYLSNKDGKTLIKELL